MTFFNYSFLWFMLPAVSMLFYIITDEQPLMLLPVFGGLLVKQIIIPSDIFSDEFNPWPFFLSQITAAFFLYNIAKEKIKSRRWQIAISLLAVYMYGLLFCIKYFFPYSYDFGDPIYRFASLIETATFMCYFASITYRNYKKRNVKKEIMFGLCVIATYLMLLIL